MLGSASFVLFVPASGSPTLKDFLAKAKTGTINIANSGPGSLGHLGAELLKLKTGLHIVSVPYKGAGPAMTDTISGHVDATFGSTASGMPLVKNGQLRALAVASPTRLADFPDLPTFDELGIGGVHVLNWWGIIGPAGLDQARADRIYDALKKVVARPDVRERLAALGITPTLLASTEFHAAMESDLKLWRRVVKEGNIKIE
jgi:tripartite-type tricarboxylate transporter receptor subunit TctC